VTNGRTVKLNELLSVEYNVIQFPFHIQECAITNIDRPRQLYNHFNITVFNILYIFGTAVCIMGSHTT
jgi:hypothetical protein